MISFSYWYMRSGEGICLVFVSGVTALATWSHRGESAWQINQVPELTCCYQFDLGGAGYLPAHRQDRQRAERLLSPRKHLRVLFSPACRVSGWAGVQPSDPKLHARYHLACPLEGEVFGERSVSRASVSLLELRSSHCLFNKMNREVKPAICPPPAAKERSAESAEPGLGRQG